jgi:hypothetical protein
MKLCFFTGGDIAAFSCVQVREHGADVSLKAAVLPSAHKISIIRHAQSGHLGAPVETKKVVLDQKTPLQVALELKSTLYLRGSLDYS